MTLTAVNTPAESVDTKATNRKLAYSFYVVCVMAALAAAMVLISADANAQTADGAAPAASSSQDTAKPPRYSATEIGRAFNFMDTNKDGGISREEAAGFRNVVRHFDAADTNKDNALSLQEFGEALNRP